MIPFDKIYSWFFKSFNISGETVLVERLITEWHQRIMIIKRSWIFAVFTLWIPLIILILSWVSIFIAYTSVSIPSIRYTLIIGNIIMSLILIVSSTNYIRYFRSIHHEPRIVSDMDELRDELARWDKYFVNFFNWSITNQWILIAIILIELSLIFLYGNRIGDHFWILTIDTLVILLEIGFLKQYRKRMMDLEMDYNIVVESKIFFVNQSGILSTVQSIDCNKIKAVQSIFPSKIASFFNYGTINVLTEWDSALVGTMTMYYVTDPDGVVANIHSMIDSQLGNTAMSPANSHWEKIDTSEERNGNDTRNWSSRHTVDTREQVRDILR